LRVGKTKSFFVWLLFFLAGAIIGGLLGELIAGSPALSGLAPYLAKKYIIFDMSPANINLFIAQIKFGFTLQPNLISVLGVVIAMFLCRLL
jgi:hypothetical protein